MLVTDIQLLISPRESVVSQLVPIPQSVLDIPYRNSSALNELVFRATDLPPLGFTSYRVVLAATSEGAERTEESEDLSIGNKSAPKEPWGYCANVYNAEANVCQLIDLVATFKSIARRKLYLEERRANTSPVLGNPFAAGAVTRDTAVKDMPSGSSQTFISGGKWLQARTERYTPDDSSDAVQLRDVSVRINSTSGLVSSISVNGTELPLQQSLLYYSGYFGDDKVPANTSSGAYVFRPNSSEPVTITENVAVRVLKGPLVEEVHQVYNEWVSQVIRVYKEENHVEFEWLVGPIPVTLVSTVKVRPKGAQEFLQFLWN
uniref:Uncharacterized protein n=1 Tax=Timema poppense TaxID=170557 RepID=A0A7R9DNN2_TIMPO|nr:unnamed protein product [Timema poppensis]